MSRRLSKPEHDDAGTENASTPPQGKGLTSAARVAAVLFMLIFGLVLLHLLTQWLMNSSTVESIVRNDLPTFRLRYRLFNMDREMSLPAWFSSTLLCGVGLAMWAAAWVSRKRNEKGVLGWCVLGLFFVVLSLDEFAAIHEVMVPRAQALLGEYATGLLFYAWYVPALLLSLVFLLMLIPFLRRLPRRTFWLLGLGVAVYLAGAVVFEAMMGMAVESSGVDEPPLQHPPLRMVVLLVLEEGMEMAGITLLLYAMLDYFSTRLRLDVLPVEPAA